MTIPHLKNRVSLMVEMLKVKTSPSTLWPSNEMCLFQIKIKFAANYYVSIPQRSTTGYRPCRNDAYCDKHIVMIWLFCFTYVTQKPLLRHGYINNCLKRMSKLGPEIKIFIFFQLCSI